MCGKCIFRPQQSKNYFICFQLLFVKKSCSIRRVTRHHNVADALKLLCEALLMHFGVGRHAGHGGHDKPFLRKWWAADVSWPSTRAHQTTVGWNPYASHNPSQSKPLSFCSDWCSGGFRFHMSISVWLSLQTRCYFCYFFMTHQQRGALNLFALAASNHLHMFHLSFDKTTTSQLHPGLSTETCVSISFICFY